MAHAKRKNVINSDQQPGSLPKRPKKAKDSKSNVKASRFTEEAETDSDPIIESETGSDSGEDDGASWPSENDQDEVGGVELPAVSGIKTKSLATESHGAMHPARIEKSQSGRFSHDICIVLKLTSSKPTLQEKLMPNKKQRGKSAKQPSLMQIQSHARNNYGNDYGGSHTLRRPNGRDWYWSCLISLLVESKNSSSSMIP